jgi:hypothetical protein
MIEARSGERERPPLRLIETGALDRDRDLAETTGASEDREIMLSIMLGVLLGIPTGVITVCAFIAAILAVQVSFTWGALLAGVWGGLIGGAYFGGAIGLATARLPEMGRRFASRETPRPIEHRHVA